MEIINGHSSKHTDNRRKKLTTKNKGENCNTPNSGKVRAFYTLHLIEGENGSDNLSGS